MTLYTSLVAFFAAASLLTIAPGLDTALVLRTAAIAGPRRAALAGLGVAVGCFGWAILVALGLGALLAASQVAYTMLRWIGAAYLVWVGYKMLRHPRRSFVPEAGQGPGHRAPARPGGIASNETAVYEGYRLARRPLDR
jgi:threonine/homoserine/homoserine lactone efflux protein